MASTPVTCWGSPGGIQLIAALSVGTCMICMRCRAFADEGKKFCGECGAPLPWQCRVCGSENASDKRFCSDCGTASATVPSELPVVASPDIGLERRHLTIMFADLVGSTLLGRQLDPEDLRHTISAFNNAVTGAIKQFDGFVARYLGDGVLAISAIPKRTRPTRSARSARDLQLSARLAVCPARPAQPVL